jgi:CRP-like cAMP-binding protein
MGTSTIAAGGDMTTGPVERLRELTFGAGLADDVLAELAAFAAERRVPAGTVLFAEGEPHDVFSILLEGRVALDMHVPTRGDLRILTLGRGDVLAWSALVGSGRMTATAKVLDDAVLLDFDAAGLLDAGERNHELGYHLMRRLSVALSRRLLATRLQLLDLFAESAPHFDPAATPSA